jgi:hypothetical protein
VTAVSVLVQPKVTTKNVISAIRAQWVVTVLSSH